MLVVVETPSTKCDVEQIPSPLSGCHKRAPLENEHGKYGLMLSK